MVRLTGDAGEPLACERGLAGEELPTGAEKIHGAVAGISAVFQQPGDGLGGAVRVSLKKPAEGDFLESCALIEGRILVEALFEGLDGLRETAGHEKNFAPAVGGVGAGIELGVTGDGLERLVEAASIGVGVGEGIPEDGSLGFGADGALEGGDGFVKLAQLDEGFGEADLGGGIAGQGSSDGFEGSDSGASVRAERRGEEVEAGAEDRIGGGCMLRGSGDRRESLFTCAAASGGFRPAEPAPAAGGIFFCGGAEIRLSLFGVVGRESLAEEAGGGFFRHGDGPEGSGGLERGGGEAGGSRKELLPTGMRLREDLMAEKFARGKLVEKQMGLDRAAVLGEESSELVSRGGEIGSRTDLGGAQAGRAFQLADHRKGDKPGEPSIGGGGRLVFDGKDGEAAEGRLLPAAFACGEEKRHREGGGEGDEAAKRHGARFS